MSGAVRDPIDDRYVPGHGDRRYSVRHYGLDLTYAPESNRLSGTAALSATAHTKLDSFVLDLASLRVSKVVVDGKRATHTHKQGHVTVKPKSAIRDGKEFEVVVTYSGSPGPMRGLDGEAGWEELEDGAIVASQPHGAPSWYPCNDRPSDKASYRIDLSVPTGYVAVANGVPRTPQRGSGTLTYGFDQDEPMATYLATVHVGRLVTQDDTQDVTLKVVSSAKHVDSAHEALRRQPEMIAFFERVFGPYPFRAGYTTVVTDDALEIPLEAQALSIFGSNFMTDRWDHQRLIAHELAHQWFGNSLTLTTWNDIWLHEGFACYSEWLWSEESGGETAQDWAERHHRRLSRMRKDLVLADPGPDKMFDDRVYKRGALTLHALRLAVGDDTFFDVLRTWTDQHRHGSVTSADFEAVVTEVAGADAAAILHPWLRETSLPSL